MGGHFMGREVKRVGGGEAYESLAGQSGSRKPCAGLSTHLPSTAF